MANLYKNVASKIAGKLAVPKRPTKQIKPKVDAYALPKGKPYSNSGTGASLIAPFKVG